MTWARLGGGKEGKRGAAGRLSLQLTCDKLARVRGGGLFTMWYLAVICGVQ